MSSTIKVAIVGASGETGQSIVDGLLGSDTKFHVRALVRPESISKPINADLQGRGVEIIPVSLTGPEEKLVEALSGIDIVISAIFFGSLDQEIHLANAAKAAGVKRFVQSAFMVVIPPRGVVDFREKKEENLNHIQKIRLPYTYIDAGWWYQITLPRLPSGRLDYLVPSTQPQNPIGLDGNIPSALADIKDVGRYVARIITDPRTLNKRVHVYNEVYTRNQVYDLLENLSGEVLERDYISEADAKARVEEARTVLEQNPADFTAFAKLSTSQLFYSWGIRGDNTPEYADYLGYLSGKDLYPDFEYATLRDYVVDALEGKAKGVYQK
ncbi:hypothetical protein ASPWEDRAFT_111376 [Aspergillus wentii DTO 134E9]|uniref:NmrA-like domain-containing protein n=1 Tax=Aspergillus wentii DTO 134E9 TaxID=1073089 RepID=A0A1L9RMJ5_ASPWE|nr:uncharacterized protein ASPWEDRAFT_111376 [Aspergillus wentii DTO 134E9]KAI9929393.1 hypothetical protein MW887_000862 [Aspergillus wentii]OJJ36165.1 hypothetical protein ASPWEDRAFT_111376 [Aspergillus wentii DTO 134E9]